MRLLPGLVLPVVLSVLLALGACTGASRTSTAPDGPDASDEIPYGGGTSIIPSGTDGATVVGVGYGADSAFDGPCSVDGAPDLDDADPDAGARDAGDATCGAPLAPGDLVIDELMIASQAGDGDHGEWLEVRSTRDCALDLKGLYAEAPHGSGMTLASVTVDTMLAPRGVFLVADSTDPSDNHDLPGLVVPWGAGTSSDVLLNSGDTITLYTANATIDSFTYPSPSALVDGVSLAFPATCSLSLRSAFGDWQASIASWSPGFFGTPGQPNTDVSCPVAPPPPGSSPCPR